MFVQQCQCKYTITGYTFTQIVVLYFLELQIQCDAGNLSPEGRNAIQNALLVSAKKFSNGPPQVHNLPLLFK